MVKNVILGTNPQNIFSLSTKITFEVKKYFRVFRYKNYPTATSIYQVCIPEIKIAINNVFLRCVALKKPF